MVAGQAMQNSGCPTQPVPTSNERCRVPNRTAPSPLKGYNELADYCFDHVSDVDVSAGLREYRYWIRNVETKNYLQAEWIKAGIPYSNIDPSDCAFSQRNSSFENREDPDAPVTYGRRKEFQKQASLYVLNRKAPFVLREQAFLHFLKQPPTQVRWPSLTSQFYAKLIVGPDSIQTVVVDIETRSEYKDNGTFYQIINRASVPLFYSVPILVNRFGRSRFLQAVEKSMWKLEDREELIFRIEANSYANLIIDDVAAAEEVTIPVRVHNPAQPKLPLGTLLISGYVGK